MDMNIVYIGAFLAFIFLLFRLFGSKRASSEIVKRKIESGALVLDVRSPAEFSQGSFPKAKNIPLDGLAAQLGKLGPKDRAVVCYCASGSRSAQAVSILKRAGFTDVVNAGGLSSMPR